MMDRSVATYGGEENQLSTGDEARSYARIAAIPALLAMRAAGTTSTAEAQRTAEAIVVFVCALCGSR